MDSYQSRAHFVGLYANNEIFYFNMCDISAKREMIITKKRLSDWKYDDRHRSQNKGSWISSVKKLARLLPKRHKKFQCRDARLICSWSHAQFLVELASVNWKRFFITRKASWNLCQILRRAHKRKTLCSHKRPFDLIIEQAYIILCKYAGSWSTLAWQIKKTWNYLYLTSHCNICKHFWVHKSNLCLSVSYKWIRGHRPLPWSGIVLKQNIVKTKESTFVPFPYAIPVEETVGKGRVLSLPTGFIRRFRHTQKGLTAISK